MGSERAARSRIEVEAEGDGFRVRVDDGASRTSHFVTVSAEEQARYGPATDLRHLVEESFRFLLEREPAAAILPRFALSAIERYFPEYPEEIRRRLGGR
ncbi:hypothetical protein HRbin29_01669 [bacterium HR29]|jgi:hypothetical protein|nr:hypothetical protein HRbin29_01669 [bacterium HR29]